MKRPYNLDELDIREQRVPTNGIELNVFTAGKGPLVILAHGFPEGWVSWGPQIHHLVAAGYRVAVPEMIPRCFPIYACGMRLTVVTGWARSIPTG